MKFYFGAELNVERQSALWRRIVAEPPPVLAVDSETISLKDRTILGVGVAISQHESFYITEDDSGFNDLLNLLRNPLITKVYHNAPYDLRVMRKYQVDYANIEDTSIAARLSGISGMLEEAAVWAGVEVRSVANVLAEYGVTRMDQLPNKVVARKCCVDCEGTFALWEYLQPTIHSDYYQTERTLIPVLEIISQQGIKLDAQRNAELAAHYTRDYLYYKTLASGMGFNPGSGFEVGYMLSEAGAFLPFTESKKQLATTDSVLSKITAAKAIPIAQLTLMYRKAQKQLSTFITPYTGLDRAYTTLHLNAATGRISGTSAGQDDPDRNLLNITKRADRLLPAHLRIRSQFIPDDGVLTQADDSQAEMRILAYMSGDVRMLAVFAVRGDIHSDTERALWGTDGPNRLIAKIFNYAMLYGADASTIADGVGTADVDMVADRVRLWSLAYPQAWAWRQDQIITGIKSGYVETLYGRKMPIPMEFGEKHAANCCINYPIQGTAADIFKRTLLVWPLRELLLPVHDERVSNGVVKIPTGIEDISPVHIPIEVNENARWQ